MELRDSTLKSGKPFFGPSSELGLSSLWRDAAEKGARSYTIIIGADGEPKLKEH